MTYDHWKTTEPDDQLWEECSYCGKRGAVGTFFIIGIDDDLCCEECCRVSHDEPCEPIDHPELHRPWRDNS